MLIDAERLLADTIARIAPLDAAAAAAAARAFDAKTKPRGSLGRLEHVAAQVAGIRGDASGAPLDAAVVVAAGDHGVAAEGVSAYPAEVTAQMLANFAGGGAAISVLARRYGARLVVVDAGVAPVVEVPGVRRVRIGAGTRNFLHEPAMTRADTLAAVAAGIHLANELAADGAGLVALGEMGIGNTTAASALCAALLPAPAAQVCGPGTGIAADRLAHKIAVIARAVERHADSGDTLDALAALGGFELAFLAGLALGGAAASLVVLLDGFVVGAAALAAARLAPAATARMIAGHRSPEPGHRLVLDALELRPLLDLELRLGEGSGALLALPLVDAALALRREMATFEQAGVSDSGA